MNKLLHGPMQALRSDGSDRAAVAQTLVNMHALELMFDLRKEDEIEEKEKKNKKEAERKKSREVTYEMDHEATRQHMAVESH